MEQAEIMALALPGYCYFSFPKTLIASFNEEQLLLEILVMCGQNVGAGVTIEWPPDRPILMRSADAQASSTRRAKGSSKIANGRTRSSTKRSVKPAGKDSPRNRRWDQVTLHPAVKGRREPSVKRVSQSGRTDKTPQEILWFLMGGRPLLVKS